MEIKKFVVPLQCQNDRTTGRFSGTLKILKMETINYRGYEVNVREDEQYYYIDFQTGLGEGIYPKADFTLEKALDDQYHIFDEQYL